MNSNFLGIMFVDDETDKWRAADLLPRECCTIGNDVYIKLGVGENNTVELHADDEYRMAGGEAGSYRKKHFFFHANSCSVVALLGETLVIPRRMEMRIGERVTFTPRSTVPFDREIKPITIETLPEDTV